MVVGRVNDAVVRVDADAAVWLTGPRDPAEGQAWVGAALQAVASDFGLPEHAPEHAYLQDVLTAFATTDLGSAFRFLRMRSLADPPLIVRLDVLPHDPAAPDPLLIYDDDLAWYDHAPKVVDVAPALGLRRAVRIYVDDGLRAVVRHHRSVLGGAADVIMTCTGFDLMAVGTAMGDLDQLAANVQVSVQDGT